MSGSSQADAERRGHPLVAALEGGLVPNRLDAELALSRLKHRRWITGDGPSADGGPGNRDTAFAFDPTLQPYHQGMIEAVSEARKEGRRTVLLSRGAAGPARAVADHLGIFDEVLGLDGASRGDVAKELGGRFGEGGFDLLTGGRGWSWLAPAADQVHVIASAREFPWWRTVARALRVHQWLKNLLVFLPVLAGQQLTDARTLVNAALAFLSFSLVASSVYVVNDVLDLREDRRHPSKRKRPFASGALPLSLAPWLTGALFGGGVLLAALVLPPLFAATLGAYFVLTSAYTLRLKGAVLIDVLTLASLYTLRVLGGSAATGITPSVWLLGFSLFFFLSLAMVKRYAELHATMASGGEPPSARLPGRSYQLRDLPVLIAMGVGTGCMAVLVLALYVISDEFSRHYRYPWLIWQLCPLALYWIGRAWIVVARDEMTDDPVIWAVKDQLSRWVGILAILILLFAR